MVFILKNILIHPHIRHISLPIILLGGVFKKSFVMFPPGLWEACLCCVLFYFIFLAHYWNQKCLFSLGHEASDQAPLWHWRFPKTQQWGAGPTGQALGMDSGPEHPKCCSSLNSTRSKPTRELSLQEHRLPPAPPQQR